MRRIILAAFAVSAISAIQIDHERLIKNKHGFEKDEKKVDFKLEKVEVNNHRNLAHRGGHRFHKKESWSKSQSCSDTKSWSKSKSDSCSDSKDKKPVKRHFHKRAPQHRFPVKRIPQHKFPVKRDEKEIKILKVGDAQ